MEWNGRGAQKRCVSFSFATLFGKNLRPPFATRASRPRREGGGRNTADGFSSGVKYQGGTKGRTVKYRWNRGNEPDIDRIDRAYSPRLYVRLFAEK